MIKKIVLTTTLLTSLAYGDMTQKGFIVGFDVSMLDSSIEYANKGAFQTNNYASSSENNSFSGKIGYQYYFTRVYVRINQNAEYKDENKGYYKVRNQVIELNADYLPILYSAKDNKWNIRGIIGVGVGANRSQMSYYSTLIDSPESIFDKETKYNMEYGFQIGTQVEFDFGLSAELGYRARSGLMAEFSDADGVTSATYEATFKLKTSELYLGLNYLF